MTEIVPSIALSVGLILAGALLGRWSSAATASEDTTRRSIALMLTIGLLVLMLLPLLGFVDLKDSTSAQLVGTVVGYAAGKLDSVLEKYFGTRGTPVNDGKQGQP